MIFLSSKAIPQEQKEKGISLCVSIVEVLTFKILRTPPLIKANLSSPSLRKRYLSRIHSQSLFE